MAQQQADADEATLSADIHGWLESDWSDEIFQDDSAPQIIFRRHNLLQ